MTEIGAHIHDGDPVVGAEERKADVVQVFLGDPQGWGTPSPAFDVAALRASGLPVYVHAPYVLNLATDNNRIRMPSRKLLAQHADAAAALGARALVVHGGHVSRGVDPAEGFANWRKALQRWSPPLPILIENTAGGDRAMARRFDAIARLWEAVGEFAVGFCLDTCHAHAGGEDLPGVVERVRAITGRVDLVHANDSKDEFGSGRDRHENFGAGQIASEALVEVVASAGAPVICETPGGAAGQSADIAFLRARLP
jgi:deoxyribonuclease-4